MTEEQKAIDRIDLLDYVLKGFLHIVRHHNEVKWDACSQVFGPIGNGLGFDPDSEISYASGEGINTYYKISLAQHIYDLCLEEDIFSISEIVEKLKDIYEKEPDHDEDWGNGMGLMRFKKEALQAINYIETRFQLNK